MQPISVRALLVRGMIAGLAAGALALVVAYFLGEPQVDAAIAYEDSHGGEQGVELVSRTMQATGGLATGVLVYGVAFGGITALAFCVAWGRIGRFSPRAAAALVSAGGLLTVYVVPFLKYPANPPAASDPDTLGKRTALYFLMIALSVLLAVGAVILGRGLAPRLGNWYATVAASAAFIVMVGLAYVFLPGVNETPADFPATVMWRFRVDALAIQCTLWAGFGLLFGHLAGRLLAPVPASTERPGSVAAQQTAAPAP